MHGRNQISDDFEAKRDVTYPLLLEKYRDVAAEQGPRTERRFVASLSASLARDGIQNGRYRDAVHYLLKSIKHSPTNVRAYPYLVLASGGKYLCEPAQRAKRRVRQLAAVTGVASTDADRYQDEPPFSPTERAE
jgi:muramidase (phage lysozyme)